MPWAILTQLVYLHVAAAASVSLARRYITTQDYVMNDWWRSMMGRFYNMLLSSRISHSSVCYLVFNKKVFGNRKNQIKDNSLQLNKNIQQNKSYKQWSKKSKACKLTKRSANSRTISMYYPNKRYL